MIEPSGGDWSTTKRSRLPLIGSPVAGWSATATALVDYLWSVDRESPDGEVEVVNMVASITLVEAVKGEN